MPAPPSSSTAFINPPIERRYGCEHQEQQCVRGRVQGEVKSAVHQDGEAPGECSGRHATPELIVCVASRETSAEKNDQKTHAKQSAHDPAVGQRLQIIIVGLLKTIQPVARIVTRVDNTERTKT